MAAITTTGTLTAGNSRTFALAPGSALTLTLLPNCRVTVTETPETVSASDAGGNSPRTHNHQLAGVVTYGPYAMGGSVVVENASNSGSTVTWGRKDTVVTTSSDGTSLVSGDGIPLRILGFSAATTIPEIIFDQSKGGKYLFTQYDGTFGSYLSALSIATGTLDSLSKTSLQAVTNVSSLKDASGVAITAGDISHAWWLSETRFLFVGRKLSNQCYYIWLCNYNGAAWTVGSNSPAFDNGNAVLAIGLYSGGQASQSRSLHARSMAVKSSTEAVFGEYNVNPSRTAGGISDAVRVHRTTDGGATWTAILTLNTDGSTTQARHCHGVRYDRYTGDWYMLFGDDPLSAIVRWDGVSASPVANTPLTQAGLGSVPGWEVMHDAAGLECRSGDISIHPQTVYYMADNSEVNTATKYAFQISKSRPMSRVQMPEYERTTGRPPLIQCEMANGAAFWASMRETTDSAASPETFKGYDFWYTPDGYAFVKIAKTRDNSGFSTGVLAQLMMTNEGLIVMSAASGTRLLAGALYGSVIVRPLAWDGTVRTLQGAA